MKKINFIPLLCGFLFVGNFHCCIDINANSKEDFYNEYFEDLNKLKQTSSGMDFVLDSEYQELAFRKCLENKCFKKWGTCTVCELDKTNKKVRLEEKFVLDSEDILNGEVKKLQKINDNNSAECADMCDDDINQDSNSRTRYLIFSIAKTHGDTEFYVRMPRIFLTFPEKPQYRKILEKIFGDGKKSANIKNYMMSILTDYFCINNVRAFLSGEKKMMYNFCLKTIYDETDYSIDFSEFLSDEEVSNSKKIALLTLVPENNYDIIDDKFINFCKDTFEKDRKIVKGTNSKKRKNNIYFQWLDLLKSCEKKIFVGLSTIYVYFPVPKEHVEKAQALNTEISMCKSCGIQ